MRFTVLTLFSHLFDNFLNESIIAKAIKSKKIQIEVINFRNWSTDRLKRVDDYQIGGGEGMVIALPPIVSCLKEIKTKKSLVVLLSPQGKIFNQQLAQKWAFSGNDEHIILICGRYEGFDERILNYVDDVVSIGDFILNGGEVAAMAIIEATSRLIKGVIKTNSAQNESFTNYLLDYPVYTKPDDFEGYTVPSILKSGNHQAISKYRLTQQELKTKKQRPDLYKKYKKYIKYK